jgi:hypothetical protein
MDSDGAPPVNPFDAARLDAVHCADFASNILTIAQTPGDARNGLHLQFEMLADMVASASKTIPPVANALTAVANESESLGNIVRLANCHETAWQHAQNVVLTLYGPGPRPKGMVARNADGVHYVYAAPFADAWPRIRELLLALGEFDGQRLCALIERESERAKAANAPPQPDPFFVQIAQKHQGELQELAAKHQAFIAQRAREQECDRAAMRVADFVWDGPTLPLDKSLEWAALFRKLVAATKDAGWLDRLPKIADFLGSPRRPESYHLAGRLISQALNGDSDETIAANLRTIARINGLRDGLECAAENLRIGGPFQDPDEPVVDITPSTPSEQTPAVSETLLVAQLSDIVAGQPATPPAGTIWSEADTPSRWAKKFGFSTDTLMRRFKDGSIRHKKLSTKSYQIHVDDLPRKQP